jgi:hypothetical protein
LNGQTLDILAAGEENNVSILFDLANDGTDIASQTLASIPLAANVIPTDFPSVITYDTSISPHLIWDAGDLAPGSEATVTVTFRVKAPEILGGSNVQQSMLALIRSDARFVNIYAGQTINAQVGASMHLPYGVMADHTYSAFLPSVLRPDEKIAISFGSAIPFQLIQQPGITFYTKDIQIPSILSSSGHFYLSSDPNTLTQVRVDDEVALQYQGNDIFSYTFSSPGHDPAPATVEIPRDILIAHAGQTLTVEYRDVYGYAIEADAIWLIWVP